MLLNLVAILSAESGKQKSGSHKEGMKARLLCVHRRSSAASVWIDI